MKWTVFYFVKRLLNDYLFDNGCQLSKASFVNASSVLTGSTKRTLNCGLVQADGYFDLGTITFTSGDNIGITRTVHHYTVGHLYLAYSLPVLPAISDTFNAYAGCDKRLSTCTDKFNNKANFRGFPFMPVPEASI